MERIDTGGSAGAAPPRRARPGIGRAARLLSASLLCLAALSAPELAQAAPGGGGGGGGFHAGGFGGFRGGSIGGFHGGVVSGFHGGIPGGAASGFHAGSPGGVHGASPGGFHASGPGEFHSGGFSGSGFHVISPPGAGMDRSHVGERRGGSPSGSIVLRGGERAGHRSYGWRNGQYGWWWGYDPYLWSSDGLYDDNSGDDQGYGSQAGYYCSDPAGYYPYVTQCNTAWQTVPAP